MQKFQFIIYHNNQKTVPAVHETINQEEVHLSQLVVILVSGKWKEKSMNELCPLIKEWKVSSLMLSKSAFIYIGINVHQLPGI